MDILEAVNDYILQYTDVVQDNLYRGYRNRATLPKTDDYTMYWMGDTSRVGTNVDEFTAQQEVKINTLQEKIVEIDFCHSDQDIAMNRAKTLAVLGRSYISCEFFKKLGFNFNFADDMQYLPFVDENEQWVHRYRIALHLTEWDNITLSQQNTENIKVEVVNVDVAYPPQQKGD